MPRGVYERAGAKPEPIHITYWDIVEAALTALPESYSAREEALRAFDHLKERVLSNYEASNQESRPSDV